MPLPLPRRRHRLSRRCLPTRSSPMKNRHLPPTGPTRLSSCLHRNKLSLSTVHPLPLPMRPRRRIKTTSCLCCACRSHHFGPAPWRSCASRLPSWTCSLLRHLCISGRRSMVSTRTDRGHSGLSNVHPCLTLSWWAAMGVVAPVVPCLLDAGKPRGSTCRVAAGSGLPAAPAQRCAPLRVGRGCQRYSTRRPVNAVPRERGTLPRRRLRQPLAGRATRTRRTGHRLRG